MGMTTLLSLSICNGNINPKKMWRVGLYNSSPDSCLSTGKVVTHLLAHWTGLYEPTENEVVFVVNNTPLLEPLMQDTTRCECGDQCREGNATYRRPVT